MKLPKGRPGIQIITAEQVPAQCAHFQECWVWFRPGDEYVEIHAEVRLCRDHWPDEITEARESRRPQVCDKCNTLHPKASDCW